MEAASVRARRSRSAERAQVKIGGTAATTAYVDANTLSAVAPGGSPGAARVEIVNGNGESYGLDAAISYTQ